MTHAPQVALAAAALAASLACRTPASPSAPEPAAGAAAAPAAEAPAAPPALPADAPPAEVLPGVSLEGLTEGQQEVVASYARSAFCHCGCPHRLSDCLRGHSECKHAPRMAALAVEYARRGLPLEVLRKALGDYYASFDRRARFDLAAAQPPFGDASAPLTLVELSDFTCPFCQRLRPVLERYVEARAGRVKLVYKPFPIESHPGALEAAQAVEWARDAGIFWKMHDALFMSGDHSLDALAEAARQAGGDEADLRDALLSGKYLPRVRAAQAEGRAAGLTGTPTLYLEGRKLLLPDYDEALLDHTLADEEEWKASGGWARD